jgi:hypothetical protein
MTLLDIKQWLIEHSVKQTRVENECRFEHFTGETSVLVVREEWKDGLITLTDGHLQSFYSNFYGASIGNGHIVIGTNILGGLRVSHGFRLPDLDEMRAKATALSMKLDAAEEVFMQSAGWMFIYSVSPCASELRLRQHDRDFRSDTFLNGIQPIFDCWWQI